MTSNHSMPPGIIISGLAYADVRTAVAGPSCHRWPTPPWPIGVARGSTSP